MQPNSVKVLNTENKAFTEYNLLSYKSNNICGHTFSLYYCRCLLQTKSFIIVCSINFCIQTFFIYCKKKKDLAKCAAKLNASIGCRYVVASNGCNINICIQCVKCLVMVTASMIINLKQKFKQ